MQLRIGQKVFAPSLWATILVAALLPVFISLGNWQLRRAEAKRVLMVQAAVGQNSTVTLSATNAYQLPRYQHVRVRGSFDDQHQVLLDSMPSSHGQPGYRVWTPFKLDDASLVLVDRGWIARNVIGPGDRPTPVLTALQIDTKPKEITGIVDELPRPGIRAGHAGIGSDWPQILNYPRLEELKELYGNSLQPRLVLMDADNVDGFERQWQIKQGFAPERHIAYAVQWFGFAITLLIVYFIVNLKRIPHD
jgi:surfeit locus 1 family protein